MIEARSRALDIWVGKALCGLMTGARRVGDLLRRDRAEPDAPRRIAFVKLSEMGAILLAVPAFHAARSRVGSENLYCIVLAGNREVHELIDVFPPDNILSIRDDNLFTFAIDTLRMMWRCRREGIDTVIDLEGFVRVSAVLSYLTGARRRVGLHRYTTEGPYRGDLFTHRVLYNYYKHASVQFLTLVEALDAPEGASPLLKASVGLKGFTLPHYESSSSELATRVPLPTWTRVNPVTGWGRRRKTGTDHCTTPSGKGTDRVLSSLKGPNPTPASSTTLAAWSGRSTSGP